MKTSSFITILGLSIIFSFSSCKKETEPVLPPWPLEINTTVLARQRIERINKDKPMAVKIVMLGNSITEGGGDWNQKLGREDVFNCGQGGYTTQQFTWLLDSCVFPASPEYCFIAGGINDLSLGVPTGRIFDNYQYLVQQLLEKNIKVVIQSTILQSEGSPNNPRVKELNRSLKQYCRHMNIPFIDLNKGLSNSRGLIREYTNDGTHLTREGYTVWSEILMKWMKKEGI